MKIPDKITAINRKRADEHWPITDDHDQRARRALDEINERFGVVRWIHIKHCGPDMAANGG